MNVDFKRLLGDATRLTKGGDLAAATRTIREALQGGTPRVDPATPSDPAGPTADAAGRPWSNGWPNGSTSRPTSDAGHDAGHGGAARARETGTVGPDGRVTRGVFSGRGRALDYRLYVPPRAEGLAPPALVVMLHGCTQGADDFARGTRMDALAREHGFIVLYPEQSGRANAQRCWNWFKPVHQRPDQGEPWLIDGAIRQVVDAHGVDEMRIFAAGLSAGGAMAAILGAVQPARFRAIGVHSGLAAGSANSMPGALAAMRGGPEAMVPADVVGATQRLPPTIVFHGQGDRTVHPENGERVVAACVEAERRVSGTAPASLRRNGRDGGRAWTCETYRAADDTVVAEHWIVEGAGHAWVGGDPAGSYTDAAGPDASAEMVRFFLSTGRR